LSGSETVLVVEDQNEVRHFMCAVLEDRGYRVMEAASCAEALSKSEGFAGPIHILVTDLVMPVMNGEELAAKLRTSRPEMRVLFTSGSTDPASAETAASAGGAAYLQKPFAPDELAAKVRAILSNSDPS